MRLNSLNWLALLSLQITAFWPVGRWYWLRLSDGPDSRWGILALVTGLIFVIKERPQLTTRHYLGWPTVTMVLYGISYPFMPPMFRAGLAILALAVMISCNSSCRILRPALLGLFFLALPVIPTLQFFLGYPMRLVAGGLAVFLLQGCGFQVNLQGATLDWGGTLILIDGPCSGVKMLWVGLFLGSTLALFHNLSTLKSITALITCLVLVIVANGLRAASLFLVEAGLYPFPPWFHEGVGLVVFTLTTGTLAWLITLIAGFSWKDNQKAPAALVSRWRSGCVS